MAVEQVNWYLRENCNADPRCDYCFETVATKCQKRVSFSETDLKIANVLANSEVKRVTLTGGEPLLSTNVIEVSDRLHSSGIRVSLHTNGLLLTNKKLDQFAGVIDKIGLPIDSVNPVTQSLLRSQEFVDKVSSRISELTEEIKTRGIGVEYHTVFGSNNTSEIGITYRRLRKNNFSSWKIYEQNFDLDLFDEGTDDGGTLKYGGTDGLQASFLLVEDSLKKYNDKRVSFISRDDRRDYFFLGQRGNIMFCRSHFLESLPVGNILTDNFDEISTRWDEFCNNPTENDEEQFWQRQKNLPFFKRYYWGWYDLDLENIDGRSWPKIERLAGLYMRHVGDS